MVGRNPLDRRLGTPKVRRPTSKSAERSRLSEGRANPGHGQTTMWCLKQDENGLYYMAEVLDEQELVCGPTDKDGIGSEDAESGKTEGKNTKTREEKQKNPNHR